MDDNAVPVKEPGKFLVQPDLIKHDMQEVVMKTTEPASNREFTDRVVKILKSIYTKYDLDKVSEAAVQLDKY